METDDLTIRLGLTRRPETFETKFIVGAVLEGLILKLAARQWGNPLGRISNELAEAAK
jgi:hypothetical protein